MTGVAEEVTVYDLLESNAVPVSAEEMKAYGLGVASSAVVDLDGAEPDDAET